MPHVRARELIHTLRHGGPGALHAAKKLLEAGPGKLSAAEAREVKALLPQLKDLFGAKVADGLSALLSGHEAAVPPALETLMPRLESVPLPQLPQRFATDLQLVRPQLTNHPTLPREEKAQRLFAFAVPFAEKLTQAPAEQKPALGEKLVANASEAGFGQLVDTPTQRTGTQVLAELVQKPTPEQVREHVETLQLDAPAWPRETEAAPLASPEHAREEKAPTLKPEERPVVPPRSEEQRSAPSVREEKSATPETPAAREADAAARNQASAAPTPGADRQLPQPTTQRREESDPEALQSDERRTNKRLGQQMLWNVLHLFRDDGRDGRHSAKQQEELNHLAIGMVLAVGLLTLIAILAVMARM